jgi:hypothetical protein
MESFQVLFQGKTAWVSHTMEVKDDFLQRLVDKNILRKQHARKIKEKKHDSERADELMEILERRPYEEIPDFISVLIDTNQEYVAELIWPGSTLTYCKQTHGLREIAGFQVNLL